MTDRRVTRFTGVLALIALAALAVRVGYVVLEKWDEPMVGDQIFYNAAANRLSDGDGFVVPFSEDDPKLAGTAPAADHAPLTVIVLAPTSWISGWEPNAHRLTMALLGTVGVVLIGLLGRAVAGEQAGLIAAGIAAVYPNLWVNDALVMSETLSTVAVALVLLLAYRFARQPGAIVAASLGATCGFAALARAELLLLTPLLVVPAVLLARRADRLERIHDIVVALAAVLVIVGPWVVFNLGRFDEPALISTNDGLTLLGANCDSVYHGDAIGLWQADCVVPVPGDQSVASVEYRDQASRYMRDHADRIPAVVLARVGRVWSVFRPGDMLYYNVGEGRERWVTKAGLWSYYPLLIFAFAGAISLRRALDRLWPLLVPVVIVTIVAAITYGQTRFRVPAEPSLVVLAAVAVDAFLSGGLRRRGDPTDRAATDEPMTDDPVSEGEPETGPVSPR